MRILVAGQDDLFRRGVRAVLESQLGWEAQEAENGRAAVEVSKKWNPDVAILDLNLSGFDAMETARRLQKLSRAPQVMVVGTDESHKTIMRALQMRARAYLTKSAAARDLLEAVTALAARKPFLNSRVSEFLLDHYVRNSTQPREHTLTPREREILHLLTQGKSNKEMASLTGTSPKTIETHRARIMRKLKVRSVAELTRFAIRNGLTEL
jgi:DNA-binding NarL/FixJ family response regulator